MIEALFTILGTILGFVLNEMSSVWREKRKRREEDLSVCTLLTIEIDYDLKLLSEFWEKIAQDDKSEEDKFLKEIHLAYEFVQSPLPPWTRRMWDGQMARIASALKEDEIREVNAFHSRLDSVASIQSTLSGLLAEQNAFSRTTKDTVVTFGFFGPPRPFDKKASDLYNQCRNIIEECLRRGNPLIK